jgi:TPP-dependent pyruvate/acetoin dehydrogenase alpha subunit
MTKEELISSEQKLIDHWNNGDIPYLFHACGGNEDQLIDIFKKIKPTDFVFSTHRSHYHARLHGMSSEQLEAEVLSGRSMFLFMENFISSSICAGTCAMAAGMAMANKMTDSPQWVWCFVGDGAADEGAFMEALRLVNGKNLPCTFIVEDNDRSVGTRRRDRYGFDPLWSMMIPPKHLLYYTYIPTHPHAGTEVDGKPTRPNLKWKPNGQSQRT